MENRLRYCREKRGLTQSQASEALGIKTSTYRSWERSRSKLGAMYILSATNASTNQLEKIIKILPDLFYKRQVEDVFALCCLFKCQPRDLVN